MSRGVNIVGEFLQIHGDTGYVVIEAEGIFPDTRTTSFTRFAKFLEARKFGCVEEIAGWPWLFVRSGIQQIDVDCRSSRRIKTCF